MDIIHLRQFLSSLEAPLRSSGAAKVADEIHRMVDGMAPFDDFNIPEFCEYLVAAKHFKETGTPIVASPSRSSRRSPASNLNDEQLVKQLASQVRGVCESALDENQSYEGIEEQLSNLLKKPNKQQVQKIAIEIGLSRTFKTKKDAVSAIVQHATNRRATFERTQF